MKFAAFTFGAFIACSIDAAGTSKFYYDDQGVWPSVGGADNECSGNGSGQGQSPIDIAKTETCSAIEDSYKFYEGSCSLSDYKFSINDHGIKATLQDSCRVKPKMTMPGSATEYEVLQFHIHTGCEHFFDGKGCDAEMHIVHIAKEETSPSARESTSLPDLAVVGMMMFGGDTVNEGADSLIDSWSAVSCEDDCDAGLAAQYVGQSFTPYSMVPSGTPFYKYFGGLTTPPCWEAVNWNVAELPLNISWRQLLKISNLINNYNGYRDENDQCVQESTVADDAGLTSREVQDLNGRVVEKVCTRAAFISDLTDTLEQPKAASSSAPSVAMGALSAAVLASAVGQFLL